MCYNAFVTYKTYKKKGLYVMLELAEKISRDLSVSTCMRDYGLENGIIYTTENALK